MIGLALPSISAEIISNSRRRMSSFRQRGHSSRLKASRYVSTLPWTGHLRANRYSGFSNPGTLLLKRNSTSCLPESGFGGGPIPSSSRPLDQHSHGSYRYACCGGTQTFNDSYCPLGGVAQTREGGVLLRRAKNGNAGRTSPMVRVPLTCPQTTKAATARHPLSQG